MRMFFDDRQRAHAPTQELHNGGFTTYAEMPARVDAILAALGPVETPADRGEAPILAVHSAAYVTFLKDAARLCAPITPDSWAASYGSAQSALAATHAVLEGDGAAFALCRPPGHHAGADYCGGYCHLNTAAIAAQAARDAGVARVAILDIDYHHGNGTQDIFYDRGDVFYASVHADPRTDYPFFWGHADETGDGDGRGATLNLPLPHGTTIDAFRAAQTTALDAIAAFDPGLLVVSFGADTWEGDPISHFALTTPDYAVLARDIAARGWPTAIVMEGGYAVDALSHNVDSFLRGF
ncbi:MAG: histone deacetylase family protein [Sphingomonas sp.]|nr:MAG: histone deacetylase family protein [Sphingomonas sp.]